MDRSADRPLPDRVRGLDEEIDFITAGLSKRRAFQPERLLDRPAIYVRCFLAFRRFDATRFGVFARIRSSERYNLLTQS